MSQFGATKARLVLAVLLRLGWEQKRQSGSHRTLARTGLGRLHLCPQDGDEIGPVMLGRIAKKTGLKPSDL